MQYTSFATNFLFSTRCNSLVALEKLRAKGNEVFEVKIESNNYVPIEQQLNEWIGQGVPFICLEGTGFAPRDLT